MAFYRDVLDNANIFFIYSAMLRGLDVWHHRTKLQFSPTKMVLWPTSKCHYSQPVEYFKHIYEDNITIEMILHDEIKL